MTHKPLDPDGWKIHSLTQLPNLGGFSSTKNENLWKKETKKANTCWQKVDIPPATNTREFFSNIKKAKFSKVNNAQLVSECNVVNVLTFQGNFRQNESFP